MFKVGRSCLEGFGWNHWSLWTLVQASMGSSRTKEVVVEGKVGNIKRTIDVFAEDYRLISFYQFDGLAEPHSSNL